MLKARQFHEFPIEVQDAHRETREFRINNLIENLKEVFSRDGGTITVVCGAMKSGKSSFFFKFRESMKDEEILGPTFYFKPNVDTRDSNIESRDYGSERIDAIRTNNSYEIVKYVEAQTDSLEGCIIFIDEMQFYDEDIIGVAEYLRFNGAHVIFSGLDTDFKAKPFELTKLKMGFRERMVRTLAEILGVPDVLNSIHVGDLMARATLVVKLSARTEDGSHATHSELLEKSNIEGNVKIGDEEYQPVAPADHSYLTQYVKEVSKELDNF